MLIEDEHIIEILKSVAGKGKPVKGHALLKVPGQEQKIALVYYNTTPEVAVITFEGTGKAYETARSEFENNWREDNDQVGVFIHMGEERPECDKTIRFDINFQRRLTDVETAAIGLIFQSGNLHCSWVWGKQTNGKSKLMTLFFPRGKYLNQEDYEDDIGSLENFKDLLNRAGYEAERSCIHVNCDLMWKGSEA